MIISSRPGYYDRGKSIIHCGERVPWQEGFL
jgi:hypothetical protein